MAGAKLDPVEQDLSALAVIAAHVDLEVDVHGTGTVVTSDNIGQYAPAPDLTPYSTTAQVVAMIATETTARTTADATLVSKAPTTSARNLIVAQAADAVVLTLQTAASATANALEVKDSANTLRLSASSTGVLHFPDTTSAGRGLSFGSPDLTVYRHSGSNGGILRIHSNSNGTAQFLGRVGPAGEQGLQFGEDASFATTFYRRIAGYVRYGTAAAASGLEVGPYISFDATGGFLLCQFLRTDNGGLGLTLGSNSKTVFRTPDADGEAHVQGQNGATKSRLAVKMVASQSATPFEVRTSADAVLAKIGASGTVFGTSFYTNNGAGILINDGDDRSLMFSNDVGFIRRAAGVLALVASARYTTTAPTMTGAGLILANVTAAPSTDPVGGPVIYAEAGALKVRGTAGTVTTLAPA